MKSPFKNTDVRQAAKTVVEHIYLITSVLVLLSPLWGYLFKQWAGLIVGCLFVILSVQFWAGIFKEKIKLSAKRFFTAIPIIIKNKSFQLAVITLINILLIFRVTLNSQITIFRLILILFFLISFGGYLYYRCTPLRNIITRRWLLLGIMPSLFNLFFLINFVFSSEQQIEKYYFKHDVIGTTTRLNYRTYQKSGYIHLENQAYEDYAWFRSFYNFESLETKSEVTYTFENGLFGIRVLKDYKFTK